jgi:uncharacterized protein DUF955
MRERAALYAELLLDKLGIAGVPNVRVIAAQLGLGIEEGDVTGFDGALVRVKGASSGIIALRKSIREDGRKNFTIAHEIAHFVLPKHDESSVCRSSQIETWNGQVAARELEANEFAAELLLPEAIVRATVGRPEPSLAVAKSIGETFSTSLTASAYRFAELTSFRCAVVWSSQRRVSWFKPSAEFGQWVRIRDAVDPRTFAFDCFEGTTVPSKPEAVPADAWLSGKGLRADAMILEESRSMPFYDAVLTLLWIKEAIEAAGSEDDLAPMDPDDFTLARRKWPRKR